MLQEYDVVIVGAGPSGLSASLYLKRAGFNVLIIEGSVPGGQLNRSNIIENYPGINSIDGPTLAYNMHKQVSDLDVKFIYENVINIEDNGDIKVVSTNNYNITSKYVIIATGRSPRKLNIENELELVGKGISYCALCDGSFFKDKNIAVIGGGASAVEEALYLSNICKKVIVINKNSYFKAEALTVEKMLNKKNIKVIYNSTIKSIGGKRKLQNITLDNDNVLKIVGLFICIGYLPNSEFINNVDKENNYIVTNEDYETNIKDIYAAGDVIKKDMYQIITACAEGVLIAGKIIKKSKK